MRVHLHFLDVGGGSSRVGNCYIEDDYVFVDLSSNDAIDNDYYQTHHDDSNNVCHCKKMKVLIMWETSYELWNSTKCFHSLATQ